MLALASSLSVGMRSKAMRMSCSPLAITLISLVVSPASYRASSNPRRSCMASLAVRSASDSGSVTSRSARVRRTRSARAAYPSGERSSSWSS